MTNLVIETATEAIGVVPSRLDVISKPLEELCIISIPKMILTIEAGVGTKTLPMLIFEAGFKGLARNWTSQVIMIECLLILN